MGNESEEGRRKRVKDMEDARCKITRKAAGNFNKLAVFLMELEKGFKNMKTPSVTVIDIEREKERKIEKRDPRKLDIQGVKLMKKYKLDCP